MARFNIDKRGYNISEVDEYINALTLKYEERLSEQKDRVYSQRNEIAALEDRLQSYHIKDEQTSKALLFAVEKAEQIENSARRIYDLEIKRIRLLYQRWVDILEETESKYPAVFIDGKLGITLQEFCEDIDNIIEQNDKFEKHTNTSSVKEDLKKNSGSYIKNLLNRMDYLINEKNPTKVPPIISEASVQMSEQHKKENSRLLNISRRFQNINNRLSAKDNTTTSFLENISEIEEDNAYFKNIAPIKAKKSFVGESGFNLEEALNPKEELEEIMKAFDFYNSST